MKRIVLAALLAVPSVAQTNTAPASPAPPADQVQKLVMLKYVDPNEVANLLHNIFGTVVIQPNPRLKAIALSGPKDRTAAVEDAIKQLDVPSAIQKDVDLTVYFVTATDQANPSGSPVPQDLQGTIAQIKNTFPYKNYFLLDVLSLRTRSGQPPGPFSETSGQLGGGRFTQFRILAATVDADGSTIRLDRLHAGLRIPQADQGKTTYVDTGVSTEVMDVKAGQKLVIGRSSLSGSNEALFVVLIAQIVN